MLNDGFYIQSNKWSMSSHKAKTMARHRLVNGIHVMKSFPNAAQVVNSMSWFQHRGNARLPVAEHASDEGRTPCTCLTRYASGLNLFDIPLRHCSCPKVWSQSVASKTWQHTDSSDDLLGFQSSQPTRLQYIRCIGVGHAKGIEKTYF